MMARWRPERGDELSVGRKWLSPWQWLRWSTDMHPVSHRGEVQLWGTWRATTAAYRRRGHPTDDELGWSTAALAVAQSGRQIFTRPSLSAAHGARITTIRQQPRRKVTGDEQGVNRYLLQFGVYCTMANSARWTDRASLSPFFSDFQMATHPVTYSKVVEL
jgi:hypothetical protein